MSDFKGPRVTMMDRRDAMRWAGRTILAGLCPLLAWGCGESFKDEDEELDYLSSLSNPTSEQFKRRRALAVKLAARDVRKRSSRRCGCVTTRPRRAGAGRRA